MQYGILILPKLREIQVDNYDEMGDLSEFCRAITHWVIPNLRILKFGTLYRLGLTYVAFTALLRVHGRSLWHLEIGRHYWPTSPLMEVLSLCNNLRSFTFVSGPYIHLSHFPVHASLEKLELYTISMLEEQTEEVCMLMVQEFTSRWRAHLPSLRMVKFQWSTLFGRPFNFNATFCTEDDFYTFKGVGGVDRRYLIGPGEWAAGA
jgi:hypothetical protein